MTDFMTICAAKDYESSALKFLFADISAKHAQLSAKNAELNALVADLQAELAEATAKPAQRSKEYANQNRIKCECGGTTSKTPSIFKQHMMSKKHMSYTFCQATVDDEEEEIVIKPRYNKARYANACRDCPCGGKTSTIASFAKRHENARGHQLYVLDQAYSNVNV